MPFIAVEGERRRRSRVIAMASLVLVAIIICATVWILPFKDQADGLPASVELQNPIDTIAYVCNSTRYPELCYSSLSPHLGSSPAQPKKLLHVALTVAMDEANKAFALVSRFVKQSMAIQDCVQLMDITRDQLYSSISLLKRHDINAFTREQDSDLQTWLSASITNQDTCLDEISDYPKSVAKVFVESSVQNLRKLVSNSLAIAKAAQESTRPDPSPELRLPSDSMKEEFPSWLSAGDRRLLRSSPNDVVADVIVAQDGSGNFTTITEAIAAAPEKSSKRYVIKVKNGTYEENVQVGKKKTNIMLIGEGMEATIVTGSRNVVDGSTTFNSSTLGSLLIRRLQISFVSCELLSKVWEEAHLANKSESFTLNEYEGVAYVAFPSFHNIEGFAVKESKYGEGNKQTDNKVFSAALKGNDEQPALVHQGALKLFLHIMENTDFQAKMQIYTDSNQRQLKPIIFVGHSLGGAVATLATLWVLEKRLRQSSPLCITFGSPLVGDVGLVEAVGRENWAGNFCHVVSKHDIVPRMLLAPSESVAEPLIALLPYWQGIMTNGGKTVPDSSIQDAVRTLLNNVLQYTCTVTNYGPDSPRELDGVIKRSPYRPFGTYIFCSGEGAACIDNSETVLKILNLTMQSHEKPYDDIVQDCFSEHVEYGSVLNHVIEKSISGRRTAKPDSESSDKMGMSLLLEAVGVDSQNDYAPIALQMARDIENKHSRNVAKLAIELSEKQCIMTELEWSKERSEKENAITYYDSCRKHEDMDTNLRRERLAGFWDEIIEMWERHELPSDFQSQNKWINAGNTYRRLVEPLDIAHYYRMCEGKGNYLSDGRPTRHKVLEKWMEEKEKTRSSRGRRGRTKLASLTQDSCFWAQVEEALKEMKNLEQGEHQKLGNLEMFEGYATKMINDRNISADVFLEGSSFMKWWKEWIEYKRNRFPEWRSPLYEIMETGSCKG